MSRPGLILKLSCFDQPGIVAKVANYVAGHRGNLVEFAQFSDKIGGKFFARLEIETRDLDVDVQDFIDGFLPAFIGANPYTQAFERGVKLIGATCHYVTADLDAGPIIEQEVDRVQHFHAPNDLVRLGRHCERIALAKGIRFHVHDRTIIDGHRAIVFPD